MALSYPDINGVRASWADVECSIGKTGAAKKITRAVKSINFTDELKPGVIRGNSAKKQGRTLGIHDPSADATFFDAEFTQLVDDLGDGFGAIPIDITICYVPATGLAMKKVELIGCRITKHEGGGEEGEDALEVAVDLDPMDVLINGKSICPKPS